MAVNDLPDELLETTFLRVASPICLVHAASTCRRWCRIVADAGFLRLYRSKNTLTIGNYIATHTSYFATWPPGPCSSSPATMTTTMSDRFSLDFLPELQNGSPWGWGLADSHGGLLLLVPHTPYYNLMGHSVSIALCDPLTRCYRKVTPPLEDEPFICLDAFLLCAGADKDGRVTVSANFTVLLVLFHNRSATTTACIFSSTSAYGDEEEDQIMRLVRSEDIGETTGMPGVDFDMQCAGRASGSIYWGTGYGDVVIAFNESTGEFSSLKLPKYTNGQYSYHRWNFRVVAGNGAGTASIIRLVNNDLEVLRQLDSSMEWMVEKTVRISELTIGLPGWNWKDCRVDCIACGIVADAGFLRLYCSRNSLTIGNYIANDPVSSCQARPSPFCMVNILHFWPSGSWPAAVTNVKNRNNDRFSLNFLPEPKDKNSWLLADSHGSLLLFVPQRNYWSLLNPPVSFCVCEPLTRRYRIVVLPYTNGYSDNVGCIDAVLLGVGASVSNFSLLLIFSQFLSRTTAAYIFNAGAAADDNELHLARRIDLGDIVITEGVEKYPGNVMQFAVRVGGFLYWGTMYGTVLVYNESTGEISSLDLPKCTTEIDRWNFRVIGTNDGAGTVLLIRLVKNDLEVLRQIEGSKQWTVEKTLRLSELAIGLPRREDCSFEMTDGEHGGYETKILAVIGRLVVLTPLYEYEMCPFSIDLETMEVKRVYCWVFRRGRSWVFPYEPPWPPALPFRRDIDHASMAPQASDNC
uniref:F-box domain-containing protein n=1 Tax=Leersia perrieri TaxID=77586 RepID=A0A0D9XCH6_9ORYZ